MKAWLKGGLIGASLITIIYFVIAIINSLVYPCAPSGFLPFSIWFYPMEFIANILYYVFNGIWISNLSCTDNIIVLIGTIFWFILGFIIGGIIGKLKSNKKSRKKKR